MLAMDRAPYRAERKYDEEKAGGGKEKNKLKKKKTSSFSLSVKRRKALLNRFICRLQIYRRLRESGWRPDK